jgi:transposase
MSNKPITMLQIRRILQLLAEGRSKRDISRVMHCSRHTVDAYVSKLPLTLSLDELSKLPDAELANLFYVGNTCSKPDSRYTYLSSRLDHYNKELKRTGVTKHTLWEQYREQVPNGYEYVRFCQHIKDHTRINGATMHFEHQAGDRVQIDFAGKELSYLDPSTGELVSCPVLVCVLPYSGYTYVEALKSASQEHLFTALGRCMSYFGGVPKNALSDNMKQFVQKSNNYEPTFNVLCEQWSTYYNTTLSAARVAKPKDKPTVENMVNVSYMRIYAPLRDETFLSLKELNQRILVCLDKHNRTPFQKRPYSRYDRFIQDEFSLLKILPKQPFVIKHTAMAKVQMNYHVTLGEDYHHYSVPFQNIGKQVKLVYDGDVVEVYLGMQRIAIHIRSFKKHGYTTLKEHMPERHQFYNEAKGWDSDYYLSKAKETGPNAFEITRRILESRDFMEQAYRACMGLLRLIGQYGQERFENACKRAIPASRVGYKMIANILEKGLDKQSDDDLFPSTNIPDHENIRGPEAYQ